MGPVRRTEAERQELIAEYRKLRAEGLNVARQRLLLVKLWSDFELGWPKPRSAEDGVSEVQS